MSINCLKFFVTHDSKVTVGMSAYVYDRECCSVSDVVVNLLSDFRSGDISHQDIYNNLFQDVEYCGAMDFICGCCKQSLASGKRLKNPKIEYEFDGEWWKPRFIEA